MEKERKKKKIGDQEHYNDRTLTEFIVKEGIKEIGQKHSRADPTCNDGVATFFRSDRFRCVTSRRIELKKCLQGDSKDALGKFLETLPLTASKIRESAKAHVRSVSNVALLTALQDRTSSEGDDSILVLANGHLYYHRDGSHVRSLQAAAIVDEMHVLVDELSSPSAIDSRGKRIAKMIVGDLNSTPETGTMELLLTGGVRWTHPQFTDISRACSISTAKRTDEEVDAIDPEWCPRDGKRHGNLPVTFDRTIRKKEKSSTSTKAGGRNQTHLRLKNPATFASCFDAYYDKTCTDPFPLTHCKPSFDGTLDWILAETPGLRFHAVWPMYKNSDLMATESRGIPSLGYPSDHVAVVADIAWNRDEKCDLGDKEAE
eukprot:g4246.t1